MRTWPARLLLPGLLLLLASCPATQSSTECTFDGDCLAGFRCAAGACEPQQPPDSTSGGDMEGPPDLGRALGLEPQWVRRVGSGSDDTGVALAPTGGDVLLGAYTEGAFDLDGKLVNWMNVALARLDGATGLARAVLPVGAIPLVRAGRPELQMVVDSFGDLVVTGSARGFMDCGDGKVTVGTSNPYVFVAKYKGSDGSCLWMRAFAGNLNEQGGLAVAVGKSREIYVAGSFTLSIVFGGLSVTSAGSSDAFVAQLSPDGAPLRLKRFGSAGVDAATGLAVDGGDNVIVAGSFSRGMAIGAEILQNAGETDGFVAKLNRTLDVAQWSRAFGGPAADTVAGVAVGAGGEVAVVGTFQQTADMDLASPGRLVLDTAGETDGFLLALDKDGKPRWARAQGGPRRDQARAASLNADVDVFVTGVFNERAGLGDMTLVGQGQDVFVARYGGGDGRLQWAGSYGGAGVEEAWALALNAGGEVFLTGGTTSDPLRVGGRSLAGAGREDIFVIKLVPSDRPLQ